MQGHSGSARGQGIALVFVKGRPGILKCNRAHEFPSEREPSILIASLVQNDSGTQSGD